MLNTYLSQVQRFLRDQNQQLLHPHDLISYINRARREIALRTQCIRILTPVAGQITAIQVTAPGSGYTGPTVTITPPDAPNGQQPNPLGAQATATAQIIGGKISNISVSYGGDGYFQPQVTITDPHGTGATAVAQVTPINVSQAGQEVYLFSSAALQQFPGVGQVFVVHSVSFIYAGYRYSLPCYPFSTYQAIIRQYPRQYLYIPVLAAQFGQGTNGSIYMYPIPSTIYQMEWDCFCLPMDLLDDSSFEAIPQPWQDAVPYFAAHLSYLELQNGNFAKMYYELYETMVHKYSAYARPGRATSPYGRWVWWGAAILPFLGILGAGC